MPGSKMHRVIRHPKIIATKKAVSNHTPKFVRKYSRRVTPLLVVFIFSGTLGLYFLFAGFAATLATSSEVEAGSLSGNATTKSDSNASGGSAVTFGATCTGKPITTASNIQSIVNSSANNTTFCFAPGTYHVSIAPKDGDIFDGGNQAAILDGQNTLQYGFVSGFDASGNNFASTADNVTVRGFVIQNYNSPLQNGAIESSGTSGWTIQNNHVTHNASSGIYTSDGVKVLNNLLDWNGQEGFAANGTNVLYQGNEIAHNNPNLAVDPDWEAGGGKLWQSTNATFSYNNVHDNGGNGLWSDGGNIYTTYDHNTVTNNSSAGIFHEISYDAVITNNTISGNGMPASPNGGQKLGWLQDAGIQLRSSGAVNPPSMPPPAGWPSVGILLIANNTVTNNYNGVTLLESSTDGNAGGDPADTKLPDGTPAPRYLQNILVRDNTITMSQGTTGAVANGTGVAAAWNTGFMTRNNHFEHNTYHVSNLTHPNDGYADNWFAWKDTWYNFTQWKSFGNDTTGSFGL